MKKLFSIKKKGMRFLAALLCLSMVAGIVPQFEAPAYAAETVRLNFKIADQLPNRQGLDRQIKIMTDATFAMGGWQFSKELSDTVGYNNITNLQAGSRVWTNYRVDGTGVNMRFVDGWWSSNDNKVLAFEFNAPSAGEYSVQGTFSTILPEYGVDFEVFVQDGEGNKTSVGALDASSPAGTAIDFSSVTLTQGINYLIFKGAPGSAQSIVALDNFVFTKAGGSENENPQPEEPDFLVPTGKTKTLDFKIAHMLPDRQGTDRTLKIMTDATFAMGGWQFSKELSDTVGYNNITNLQAGSKVWYQYRVDGNGVNMRFVDGWWSSNSNKVLAFEFKADSEGFYDMSGTFSIILPEYGVDFEVLVQDGNGNIVSAGKVDNTAQAGIGIDFNRVYLTEGSNYLIFKGAPGSAQSIIALDKFVFTELAEPKIEAMIVPESSSALVGESIGFKAWVNMKDGSMKEEGEFTGEDSLVVTSSDTSVAVIENGKIKAVGEGSTEIKVTAVLDGDTYEKSAEFNVISLPEGEFKLVADACWGVKPGRKTQILVQGAYSNVVIDMENAKNVQVSCSNGNATATTIFKNGNFYVEVKGVNEGDTEVTLSAEYNGKTAEVVIPVTISTQAVAGAPLSLDMTSCTWENLLLATHGIGVNKELTAPEIMFRQGWVVYIGSSAKVELKKNESVYYDVNIPADGEYIFSMNTINNVIGFVTAIYIDDQFIGEYDFADMGENPPESRDESIPRSGVLRNVKLTAGTHVLRFERVSDVGHFMWLKTLTFTPVAESPKVVGIGTTSDKNTFTPGESIKNEFSVRLSDGRDYHIPTLVPNQGKLNVTNRMPERMDYTNSIMKAKKTGMAFFQIDANVDVEGGKVSGVWNGTISEGQLADFTAANGDEKPSTSGVYEKGWAVNEDKTTIITDGTDYKLRANGFNAVFNDGEILALDTYVQNGGIYNVDAAISPVADGAVTDIYIGDKYLGRVDFAKGDADIALNTVELNSGIDTIYIKKVGGGDKIALKQLSFVRVENMPAFSHVNVENETSEIALYKTLQADVRVMMDDGREYHIGPKLDGSVDDDNKIEYSVDPMGKFSVDKSTGLMQGDAVGDAKLKAKITVKGVNVANIEKTFSVVHVLKVIPKDKAIKVLRTETAEVELSATMDDAAIDITDASEINAIPADFRTEGSVEIKDGKAILYVKGLRGGETSVDVEAVYNGVVGRVTIPVTVSIPTNNDDVLFLDFLPSNSKRPSTPGAANVNEHSWEVNVDQTSPNTLISPNYKLGGYGLQTQMKNGEQFAIDIWVSVSGNYAVDMVGTSIGPSGIFGGFYVDGEYLGDFHFAHPTSMSDDDVIPNQSKKLNSIYLSAGKHTFVIKKLAKSRPYKYDQAFWLGSLKFTNIGDELAFDYVEAKAGKNVLCVGESTSFDANVYMTDGNIRLFPDDADVNNGITIQNSNPSVAVIRDGRIHALSTGNTTFTVSGKVDGEEKIAFVDIEVDDKVLDSVDAEFGGELTAGHSAELVVKAFAGDREIDLSSVELTVDPVDDFVVFASETTLKGLTPGTTDVTVTAKLGENSASDTVSVTVVADGMGGFDIDYANKIRPDSGTQIKVIGTTYNGEPMDLTDAEITYQTDDISVINVDANGYVSGLAVGEATVKVSVKKGLFEGEREIAITVTNGKVGRSYYTDEKVQNALENANNYNWAKNEQKSAIKSADFYVDKADLLWNMVTTHALPRSPRIGFRYDPYAHRCRYCDTDLTTYGDITYVWKFDAFNSPWKIQCPACRRKFPSNDFGSFYKLGIDENGEWNYEKSHYEHYNLFKDEYAAKGVESYEKYEQMRAAGTRLPGVGYLKNTTLTDVGSVATVNNSRGLAADETVDAWGVDDGFGYKRNFTYPTPSFGDFEESHTYISYYNRFLFASVFNTALSTISRAYMYTDDIKYARAGAVLLDRIADVYPTMYWSEHFPKFAASDGTYPKGRIEGRIWETSTVKWFVHAYDALYPAFDDPYVVNYLSDKAQKYNMDNTKQTGDDIRKNIEDGVLREVFKACVDGDIHGNFGMHQQRIADVGVILDSMPESKEILDYLMAKDTAWTNDFNHTGGDVMDNLINGVDRDGGANEVAPNYSMIWYNCISDIANVINGYKGYEAADLFRHPVVQKMLENLIHLVHVRNTTAAIGDSGVTAGIELNLPSKTSLMSGFRATNNILLAQTLYFLNGNTTEGMHEDIYTKNPEGIQQDIQAIIDEHGEYPFDDSLMLPEQGYAILRDGSLYGKGQPNELDTQRDFWMNFSLFGVHSHNDMLNLGMHAYGLDVAPDLGYPTQADGGDEYINWGHATANHNTVVVDDSKQLSPKVEGFPMHFDDAGRVKVMDVDGSVAYSQTDIYRRTVVMVEASDDISYGVDFFRVRGGTEHLYSFHSQSNTVSDTSDNFTAEEQFNGTYAGENVPYRTPGITSGYSYFTNVRKAENPGVKEFYVDYLVEDFRKLKDDIDGLHMRVTMLNDFEIDEISLVKGAPPVRKNNPEWLEFMLARRSSHDGKPLDTTFTTVLEPYKETDKYIESMEQVEVVVDEASRDAVTDEDVVRAIKVKLVNGREDYIVYASNNDVRYIVGDKFTFKGFTGVCSYMGSDMVYSYLCDGTELADKASQLGVSLQKEFTGEIVDFTRDLVFDNFITVKLDGNPDIAALKEQVVGRWMYVENNINMKNGNAVYLIKDINEGEADNTYVVSLGNTPLIRSGTNLTLVDGNYTFNIAPRQWFNIPMSGTMSAEPVFTNDGLNETAVQGKEFSKTVKAESPSGRDIVYKAVSMPRGAMLDEQTGKVIWVPTSNQIGEFHFAIQASDGLLDSTLHFNVDVHKSATGSSGADGNQGDGSANDNVGGGAIGGGAAGGGAGGGGAGAGAGGGAAGGNTSTDDKTDEKPDEKPDNGNTDTESGEGTTDEGEKFIDIGNHSWAKDAIYSLVEKGVVNGTGTNTYSPAKNIKRADFAIMLTRAFKIGEGETEQFADVDSSKYYAEELRLAKAAGIVAGIGDNKFNPEGEISRQDMMLMLYRALKAQGYELSEPDHAVLAEFSDAALISDYAKDAVAVFVKDGIIAGSNGQIRPKAQATRAEIAVMLNRVIKD